MVLAAVICMLHAAALTTDVNVYRKESEGTHKRHKHNSNIADLCEPKLEILGQGMGKMFTRVTVPHEWADSHRVDAIYLKDESDQIVAGAMCKEVHGQDCEFDRFRPGDKQVSVTFDITTKHKHLTAYASCSHHGMWSSSKQSVAAGIRKAHSLELDNRARQRFRSTGKEPTRTLQVLSLGGKTKIPQHVETVKQWLDFSGVKHNGIFISKLDEFGIQISEDLLQLDEEYLEELQSLLEPIEQTKFMKALQDHPEI